MSYHLTKITTKVALITLTLSTLLLSGCVAVVAGGAASGVIVAQDRRTAGTIVEDSSIEFKAQYMISELTLEKDKPKVHAGVVSYNGNVLILGQVPTEKMRQEISRKIHTIPKVNTVHNELTVSRVTPMSVRTHDSLLTTKVKSSMVISSNRINVARIKVVTEDGVVYLMGIVSHEEEEIVVDLARNVKGVRKVVKMFEYL